MKSFVAVMASNNLAMAVALFSQMESVFKILLLIASCVYTTLQIVKVYRSLEKTKGDKGDQGDKGEKGDPGE